MPPLTEKRIIELRDLIERNFNNIATYKARLPYEDSIPAHQGIAASVRAQIKLWEEQIEAARAEFRSSHTVGPTYDYDTTVFDESDEEVQEYERNRIKRIWGGSKRRARRAGRSRRARRSRRSRK